MQGKLYLLAEVPFLVHLCFSCFCSRDASNTNVVHNFGDPFILRIGPDEPLSSIKARVQKKLGTTDEEFSSWRFAFHSLGRPEYLAGKGRYVVV